MNEVRRQILRAICDTVCPPLERADDPDGFWGRSGTDVGADEALADDDRGPSARAARRPLAACWTGWRRWASLSASARSREQLLRNLRMLGPAAAFGGQTLGSLALLFAYGVPDATGRNAFWATLRLSGPEWRAGAPCPRAVTPLVPQGDEAAYEADAVVVGSGAGGGVIAAALAGRAQRVLVLEMGGLFDESDFNQYELWAYQNLYWRGGPNPTADLNVSLYAGLELRRRHHDQLDELPAHEALGARAVGARARPRGSRRPRTSTVTSTRSGNGSASTTAAPT